MHDPRITALLPDAVFHGRYRVVRALRAGGMGAVYEVVDEVTNARRALKIMLPSVVSDPELRARFAREARITGDVESDHIVRVSDAGVDEAEGTPFIVMDLLRGEDLRTVLAERGPLPRADVVTYLAQVAMALDKTHAANIVHRDLKPDNLFVTRRDDGSPCVKVLDFGVAKVVQADHATDPTKPVGTPLYMAPEQFRGHGGIVPATDLYALGQVAYALLTGEPYWTEERAKLRTLLALFTVLCEGPKEAPTARARRRAVAVLDASRPPLCGELPAAFDAWFAHATAAQPQDRFERASEAVAALAELLGLAAPGAAPPVPPGTVPSSRSRAAISNTLSMTDGSGRLVGDRAGETTGTGHRAGRWAMIVAVLVVLGVTVGALLLGRGN